MTLRLLHGAEITKSVFLTKLSQTLSGRLLSPRRNPSSRNCQRPEPAVTEVARIAVGYHLGVGNIWARSW